jgi:hypothetical protein
MAGAPLKEETVLVRMAVSKPLYAYLTLLSSRSALGASENDVARYLLTQRIEQMIAARYHETHQVPED